MHNGSLRSRRRRLHDVAEAKISAAPQQNHHRQCHCRHRAQRHARAIDQPGANLLIPAHRPAYRSGLALIVQARIQAGKKIGVRLRSLPGVEQGHRRPQLFQLPSALRAPGKVRFNIRLHHGIEHLCFENQVWQLRAHIIAVHLCTPSSAGVPRLPAKQIPSNARATSGKRERAATW